MNENGKLFSWHEVLKLRKAKYKILTHSLEKKELGDIFELAATIGAVSEIVLGMRKLVEDSSISKEQLIDSLDNILALNEDDL